MVRPKALMDEKIFKNLIDQHAGTSHLVRLHNLGEPLLDKRIVDFIQYGAERNVKLEISTNSTILTEQRANDILRSNLYQIILSMDGATKETYEKIRRNADFDRVVTNITQFLKKKKELASKVRVVLQIILMDETIQEVDKFINQWDEYRKSGVIDEFRIKRFSTWANQVEAIGNQAGEALRYYPEKEKTRIPCLYLWESVVVLQDGRVTPCCFDYEGKLSLGNLHENTLDEIWQSQKYQDLRQHHLGGDFNNPLCQNCIEYPRARYQRGYPFNKSGVLSFLTWLQILRGKKKIIENIPVDVTPP
jgi:radical SAM protein with 4Fe4S-binding SPASM domain